MKQIYSSNGDIDKVVRAAREYARELNHEYFMVEHLLHSLVHEKNFNLILDELGVQIEPLIEDIEQYLNGIDVHADEEVQDEPHGLACHPS